MKTDNPNFMAAVDLFSAKAAIESVLDGFDHGLIRVEQLMSAIRHLNEAMLKLYRQKPAPPRLCDCGCGREATIAGFQGCT